MTTAAERVVVALGGNALLRKGDRGTVEEQQMRSRAAMEALVPLLTPEWHVVLTHGNGPIVGNILIRHRLAQTQVPAMPLDVCGAESQGNIGYALERALLETLHQHGVYRPVATLLSHPREFCPAQKTAAALPLLLRVCRGAPLQRRVFDLPSYYFLLRGCLSSDEQNGYH